MLSLLIYLLLVVTLCYAKPISTTHHDTSLPPHAFANYPVCADNVPLINCIHPHFGTVYGPTAGHAIHHPDVVKDIEPSIVEAVTTATHATHHNNHNHDDDDDDDDKIPQLSKRHDYFLDCGKREATNWCQGPPRTYYCDARGHRRHAGYDESCEYCDCRKVSSVSGAIKNCKGMNCLHMGGSPVKEVVGDGDAKHTNGTVVAGAAGMATATVVPGKAGGTTV